MHIYVGSIENEEQMSSLSLMAFGCPVVMVR
jgi:hypothetical protein